jgi:hypothetical protein
MSNKANSRRRRVGRGRRDAGRGANVQNEANWPPGRCRAPDAQPSIGSRAASTKSRLCKTNPISGNWPARGIPIIPRFHYSSIPIRCRLCETKPNLGRMGYLGDGAWGPIAQNEANFGEPGWDRRAKCAKRTQFPAGLGGTRSHGRGANVQNEANLVRLGQGRVPGGRKMRNEPNSRRRRVGRASGTRGKCAKQTQFVLEQSVPGNRQWRNAVFRVYYLADRILQRQLGVHYE